MAMSDERGNREYAKFVEDSAGDTAVRIKAGADDIPIQQGTNGTTDHFNNSVDTTPVNIPAVAGNKITGIHLKNLSNKKDDDLMISFDGGSNFKSVFSGEEFQWSPKNINQVVLKSNQASGVLYEIVMNRTA